MRKRKLKKKSGVKWQGCGKAKSRKTNGRKTRAWCTENSQIFGATVQNLVSTATWSICTSLAYTRLCNRPDALEQKLSQTSADAKALFLHRSALTNSLHIPFCPNRSLKHQQPYTHFTSEDSNYFSKRYSLAPRLIMLYSWFTRGWADKSLGNYSTGFYCYCKQLALSSAVQEYRGSHPKGYKPHCDHQGVNNSKCLLTTLIFKRGGQWEQVLSAWWVHRLANLIAQLSLLCTCKKESCVIKGHTSTRSLFDLTPSALPSQDVLYYIGYNYTCSELKRTCADVRGLIMVHPTFCNTGLNGKIHNKGTL